jgi:uncharacterized protein (TIGR02996 family)
VTEAEWIAFLQRPEFPAFNRAMLDNPEDDLPRLVFADWMDENCPDHEVNAAVRASVTNETRSAPWPSQREGRGARLEFVRGRLRTRVSAQLRPSQRRVAQTLWEAVWRAEWVEGLFLSGSRFDVVFGWFNSPPMEGVLEVALGCDALYHAEPKTLLSSSRLVHLSSLGLAGGRRPPSPLHGLADADVTSRLRSLSINSGLVTGDDFTAFLASPRIASMEEFCVLGTNLGDFGAHVLAHCSHLAGLKRLVYHDRLITRSGAAALADSPYLCEAIRAQWRRPPDDGRA